jgi:hypothetical protein
MARIIISISLIGFLAGCFDLDSVKRPCYTTSDCSENEVCYLSRCHFREEIPLKFIGSLDTPGSARGITAKGNYAYVADGWKGLQIIDISDPSSPKEVGNLDTPGWAYGITAKGNYAYVADAGGGLRIIDISDPSFPKEVGSLDTPGEVQDITVVDNYVYLADYGSGLWIFKVPFD